MKSNRYVYPSISFKNLRNKKIINNLTAPKTINLANLKKELKKIKKPRVTIKGQTPAEKILSIFLAPEIIFGPREFITKNKKEWLEKLNYFISRKKPIQFTLLGFPFKMPVTIKTNRTLPDMGEFLALQRLKMIADLVDQVYRPGAMINIFTEGSFGKFSGVSKKDYQAYEKFLKKMNRLLGFNQKIKIIDLAEMEKLPDFKKYFQKRIKQNKRLLARRDKKFMTKYQAVKTVIFRIVKSPRLSREKLMDVYNDQLSDKQATPEIRKIRQNIRQRADDCLINYFSYLQARDDLNFLNQKVPHSLTLSVSPKPNRLGILPINKYIYILPYHGVPVWDSQNKQWSIHYLIDLQRDNRNKYCPVFLKEDPDNKPFYYQKK